MNYKTEKRVEETKKKMRSDLKSSTEWTELNHFQNFDTSLSSIKPSSSIPRIHVNDVSLEEFVEKYERPYLPCVILGATDHWKAWEKWTPKKLAKKYRNQPFKCGEDDHGNSVKIKMKYYMEYMLRNQDDVPMYIFDASFGEHSSKKQLLEDYDIPKYFREDLFQHVGNRRRPPHRWFLCGPARSGSGIHIDPIGTSAWNSLIRGHKRWCLFPPETPAQLLKVTRVEGGKQKGEAITWFKIIYPRTQAPDWPKEFAPIEILQEPGETMFVPGGWWHVVLNLDVTIAVTQNFCSRANFPIVWNKLVHERPKLSQKFYTILNEQLPDVARIADSVDLAMQIGMQYDITGSSSSSSSNSSSGDDSEDDEDSDGHSTVTTVLTLNEDKNEKPRVFKFSYQKNTKNQPAQQSLD